MVDEPTVDEPTIDGEDALHLWVVIDEGEYARTEVGGIVFTATTEGPDVNGWTITLVGLPLDHEGLNFGADEDSKTIQIEVYTGGGHPRRFCDVDKRG